MLEHVEYLLCMAMPPPQPPVPSSTSSLRDRVTRHGTSIGIPNGQGTRHPAHHDARVLPVPPAVNTDVVLDDVVVAYILEGPGIHLDPRGPGALDPITAKNVVVDRLLRSVVLGVEVDAAFEVSWT